MAARNEAREILLKAVHSALAGEHERQWNIDSLFKQYAILDREERSALVQLKNWAEDESLREFSPAHAEFGKRRLNGFLLLLSADPAATYTC